MKKLLVLMMTLTLGLTACGGDNATPASSSEVSTSVPQKLTLVSKVANYITLLVPSDFGEFYDKDSYFVAEGPNASIVISPITESDTSIGDVTQDFMVESLGNTYSNIEVLAFDNPANIAGVDSVSCLYTGDGNTNGQNKTVCQIILYFTVDGQNCEQHIVFTFNTGANSSLEANFVDILESISLE